MDGNHWPAERPLDLRDVVPYALTLVYAAGGTSLARTGLPPSTRLGGDLPNPPLIMIL